MAGFIVIVPNLDVLQSHPRIEENVDREAALRLAVAFGWVANSWDYASIVNGDVLGILSHSSGATAAAIFGAWAGASAVGTMAASVALPHERDAFFAVRRPTVFLASARDFLDETAEGLFSELSVDDVEEKCLARVDEARHFDWEWELETEFVEDERAGCLSAPLIAGRMLAEFFSRWLLGWQSYVHPWLVTVPETSLLIEDSECPVVVEYANASGEGSWEG
jgi:hypothetical protein